METLHRIDDDNRQWQVLSPVVDDALHALRSTDREAILLRFFEGHSLRSVGEAMEVSEGAAQKRLSRALERLRSQLRQRGLALGAAALSTTLQSHAASVAAPVGLGSQVAAGAFSAASPSIVISLTTSLAMMTKAKAAAFVCLAVLAMMTTIPIVRQEHVSLTDAQVTIPSKGGQLAELGGPSLRKTARDRLREIWNAERLVNNDSDRAMRLCLDGESTDRILWEKLLQKLLPGEVDVPFASSS